MTNCASAYSTANSAGWARSVGSRPVPSNTSAFRSMPSSCGESGGAPVEVLPEHRLGVVETAGHIDVLRALTGEQERHPICAWRDALRARRRPRRCRARRRSAPRRHRQVGNDGCHPDLVGPPTREGERHVGQQSVRRGESSAASAALASCSDSAVRADNSSTCGPPGLPRRLEKVCGASSTTTCTLVPPTPNELTPARRGAVGFPWCVSVLNHEWRVLEVQLGVGRGVVHGRRESPCSSGRGSS